jgi:hypothetical protein
MKKTVYIVPAPLLYTAAELLQPPERLCFVTGVKLLGGQVIVLTQLIEIESAFSRVHVAPNAASVLRAHHRLLAMGVDIEAQFHSHPGRGQGATHPSHIDFDTARRWETGAPFIGAIFSEGGRYVRFFNHHQDSEITIHGHYLETNDSKCFELPAIGGDPLSPEESQPSRLVLDGPAGTIPVVEPEENRGGHGPVGWVRRHWQ